MSTTLPYHEICRVNEQETKLWRIFRTSLLVVYSQSSLLSEPMSFSTNAKQSESQCELATQRTRAEILAIVRRLWRGWLDKLFISSGFEILTSVRFDRPISRT